MISSENVSLTDVEWQHRLTQAHLEKQLYGDKKQLWQADNFMTHVISEEE